jgi:small GTP-binding protein
MITTSNQTASSEKLKPIRKIQRKVIIIGEGGVGKTTLLQRSVNDTFIDSTKMTIGADFFVKNIDKTDEQFVNQTSLLLWDFAGQDRFRFVLKDYTQGAVAVILCFDLVRYGTLKKLYDWVDLLKEGGIWGKNNIHFFLVGTKNDLVPNNPRAISQDQIDMFKDEFNIDYEFKTSALDSDGVADLFNQICKSLIELENERENQ